jgi:hypothetical protein
MDTFAFIIHPIDPKRDVSRKYPFLGRVLTERQTGRRLVHRLSVYTQAHDAVARTDSLS